jgi:quinol monooxygenase YgiN
MSDQITIFARITPKPEHADSARAAILAIIPATRAEPGCHVFALKEAWDTDGCLYLYEVWENNAALAAHYSQSYTQKVFDNYRDWLSEPVAITKLRHVA